MAPGLTLKAPKPAPILDSERYETAGWSVALPADGD